MFATHKKSEMLTLVEIFSLRMMNVLEGGNQMIETEQQRAVYTLYQHTYARYAA